MNPAEQIQQDEQVVLLDEDGRAIGHGPEARRAPCRHAAASGLLLLCLRRRGSTAPDPAGARQADLARRLDQHRLRSSGPRRGACRRRTPAGRPGARASRWTICGVVLPRFRYRAVMADGTVENEMCPVFVAWTADQPDVDAAEVAATTWSPGRSSAAESWPAAETYHRGVVTRSRARRPGHRPARLGRGQLVGPASCGAETLDPRRKCV